MSDLPPPSVEVPEEQSVPWWKQKKAKLPVWGWLTIAVLAVGGLASAGSNNSESDDEATDVTETKEEVVVDTTEATVETTEVVTETTEPAVETTEVSEPSGRRFVADTYEYSTSISFNILNDLDSLGKAVENEDLDAFQLSAYNLSLNYSLLLENAIQYDDGSELARLSIDAWEFCKVTYKNMANSVNDYDTELLEESIDRMTECTTKTNLVTEAIPGY